MHIWHLFIISDMLSCSYDVDWTYWGKSKFQVLQWQVWVIHVISINSQRKLFYLLFYPVATCPINQCTVMFHKLTQVCVQVQQCLQSQVHSTSGLTFGFCSSSLIAGCDFSPETLNIICSTFFPQCDILSPSP